MKDNLKKTSNPKNLRKYFISGLLLLSILFFFSIRSIKQRRELSRLDKAKEIALKNNGATPTVIVQPTNTNPNPKAQKPQDEVPLMKCFSIASQNDDNCSPILLEDIANPEKMQKTQQLIESSKIKNIILKISTPHHFDALYSFANAIQPPKNDLKVFVIPEGKQFSDNPMSLVKIVDGSRRGLFQKIGFSKNETSVFFNQLFSIRTGFIPQKSPQNTQLSLKKSLITGKMHISVFGNEVYSSLVAACLVPNSVIHVFEPVIYLNLFSNCAIVEHLNATESVRNQIFSKMDINMLISATEDYPAEVLLNIKQHSLFLVGQNSPIVKIDPELARFLSVPERSSSSVIATAIQTAVENSAILIRRFDQFIENYQKRETILWNYFLDQTMSLQLPKIEGGLEPKPEKPKNMDVVPQVPIIKPKKTTIVFVTYELGTVSAGGMGMFLYGLIKELIKSPAYKIIVLYDFGTSEEEMRKWKMELYRKEEIERDDLTFVKLDSLAKADFSFSQNIFEVKSKQFAIGLHRLEKKKQFDMVEFHEYAGTSFYSIYYKKENNHYGLQKNINVNVRVHGSLEFIDLAENIYASDKTSLDMYRMERYVLKNADRVLFPSDKIRDLYSAAYDLPFSNSIVCSPPMGALLKKKLKQRISYDPEDSNKIMYFGKLQPVKGVFLIVDAAVQLFSNFPEISGKIVFVGNDVISSQTKRSTQLEMLERIPQKLRDRFEFHLGFVPPHKQLETIDTIKPRAAVIASTFETLNFVAHELYLMGVPLVISSFEAFSPYFNDGNAYIFKKNDVNSLMLAFKKVFDEAVTKTNPPLQYVDSSHLYWQI